MSWYRRWQGCFTPSSQTGSEGRARARLGGAKDTYGAINRGVDVGPEFLRVDRVADPYHL